MRKLLIGIVAGFMLSFPVMRAGAGQDQYAVKARRKAFDARQKEEWNTLKLQQKRLKQSWKGMQITKEARQQMQHQMKHERRELREKLRNDRQTLRDREQVMKQSTK